MKIITENTFELTLDEILKIVRLFDDSYVHEDWELSKRIENYLNEHPNLEEALKDKE